MEIQRPTSVLPHLTLDIGHWTLDEAGAEIAKILEPEPYY